MEAYTRKVSHVLIKFPLSFDRMGYFVGDIVDEPELEPESSGTGSTDTSAGLWWSVSGTKTIIIPPSISTPGPRKTGIHGE